MDIKEKIKNRLPISKVLEHYNVKKGSGKGSYHCPLHKDKNPSLVADDSKNIATCLSQSCFASDDIFGVIMKMDGCTFPEALKRAGGLAGVQVESPTVSKPKTAKKKKSDPKTEAELQEIPPLEPLQKVHIEFLRKRGIKNIDELNKKFRLQSWKSYIAVPLGEGKDFSTYRFTPIKKNLHPFYRGENRVGQIYFAWTMPIPQDPFDVLVCAGEKDVWRVEDARITQKDTDKNYNGTLDQLAIVSNTSGEGNIPENFFDILQDCKAKNIYICYDHDEAGQKGSKKVANLAKQKFPNANVIILNFDRNSPKKFDLTDFLNDGHTFTDIFSKLNRTEHKIEMPKNTFFDDPNIFFKAGDITGEPPPIEWIVENVLSHRTVGIVSATGSAGKSWLLMQLATCIASGVSFLNLKACDPNKVLYILGEEEMADVHRRIHSIKQYYHKRDNSFSSRQIELNNNLQFLCMSGKDAVIRPDSEFYKNIHQFIDIYKPKVIIFDPLIFFFEGDENSSTDASRFMNLMHNFKNRDITVLLAHHTNKSGASTLDQHSTRGSSAFVDNARWNISLAKLSKDKSYYHKGYNEPIPEDELWKFAVGEINKCNGFRPEPMIFSFERMEGGVIERIDNITKK